MIREKEIPIRKVQVVEELVKLIKTQKSVVVVSIKNLPTSQFQLMKKKLRADADVKVVKKNLILKAIIDSKQEKLSELKPYLHEDVALIFSKLDSFEISAVLSKNKSRTKAKVGQQVEEDVTIEPGPTELVPGPVISELGALGLKFMIEDGKISIRDKKTILKKGDTVTEQAAGIMSKLDMKPCSVGLEPIVGYDLKEHKIFKDIKIDQNKVVEDMKMKAGKALAFAVKIAFPSKETIRYLLGKAASFEKALSSKVNIQGGQ